MGVTYEITATVDEELAKDYARYMVEEHIPDLLATDCFASASISESTTGRFRIRYEASDQESLDRYLSDHADRLRAAAVEHFPEGVTLEREIWRVLKVFG